MAHEAGYHQCIRGAIPDDEFPERSEAITEAEVHQVVALGFGKAPGFDEVTAEIII